MSQTTVPKSQKLLETFRTRGYVEYKGLFTEAEAKSLIEDIKQAETIDGVSGLNKGAMTFYSGVYYKNPSLQAVVSHPKVINFIKQVIGDDFWVRWDQAVAKGPGAGTFPWHQDNAYNYLQDEHFQLWIALTKTTADNGGLWLEPKSQSKLLSHDRVGNHMVYQGKPRSPILIEAEPGDAILFSSLTLHSTTPNVTQDTRWAYVIEYMSCKDIDPSVTAPYFIVARDGQPVAEFVHRYEGRLKLKNHLKYWRMYLSNLKRQFLGK
ncbi:MAG: phytanoyl-CoA dioxygenase family protein [Cyanobacteria bacterium J06607_15]